MVIRSSRINLESNQNFHYLGQENKGEKKNKNLGGEIQGKIGEISRKQVTKGGEQITLAKVQRLCLKTKVRSISTPRTWWGFPWTTYERGTVTQLYNYLRWEMLDEVSLEVRFECTSRSGHHVRVRLSQRQGTTVCQM
ncbi:Uncharacterized protein TCM_041452 [Theobroma cacao]|uniref:Uncharacterized protein n=1 Tax=Theobroma cacao TaxID=3641 RepID=A0A061GVF5_THECC|nr:Uncharacterized protein TCM_041452 [Theobroma cacao]